MELHSHCTWLYQDKDLWSKPFALVGWIANHWRLQKKLQKKTRAPTGTKATMNLGTNYSRKTSWESKGNHQPPKKYQGIVQGSHRKKPTLRFPQKSGPSPLRNWSRASHLPQPTVHLGLSISGASHSPRCWQIREAKTICSLLRQPGERNALPPPKKKNTVHVHV